MGDKILPFAGYWTINSLILAIFSVIWPGFVVFGNAAINPVVSIIWTGFILTLAVTAVQPITEQLGIKLKKEYQMGLVYLVINVITLWILARWAGPVTGFGIGGFYVAIIIGIVVNFGQWGFWKFLSKKTAPTSKVK